MRNIEQGDLKITDVQKFIRIFSKEETQARLKKTLRDIELFSLNEKEEFIRSIRVGVCPAKCPCCGRICDYEIPEEHSGEPRNHKHRCLYGHQIRAFSGNCIDRNGKK